MNFNVRFTYNKTAKAKLHHVPYENLMRITKNPKDFKIYMEFIKYELSTDK